VKQEDEEKKFNVYKKVILRKKNFYSEKKNKT
jgi:hypothetical protein